LKRAGVCYDGYRWARKLGASARDTWEACPRADWLYFAAWKLGALDPRQVRAMVLGFVQQHAKRRDGKYDIINRMIDMELGGVARAHQQIVLAPYIRFRAACHGVDDTLNLLCALSFRAASDANVVELCYNTFRDFATSELACEVIRDFVPFEALIDAGGKA
jgi:hypothetical protein